ncbi:unnamed protein product [Coccothraustes coccothraustes]
MQHAFRKEHIRNRNRGLNLMMEISKVNEFGSFQTNYKAALRSVPVREVWREFGGRAGKPPGLAAALPTSPAPQSLAKTGIIYGQDLKANPVTMVTEREPTGPPQNRYGLPALPGAAAQTPRQGMAAGGEAGCPWSLLTGKLPHQQAQSTYVIPNSCSERRKESHN